MKRKSFHYRAVPFPPHFVRRITDRQPDLVRLSSANGQRDLRARKIFVIKQVSRPFDSRAGQALPSTTAGGKRIQRILIFDNHPDSLRLLFGRGANAHVDLASPRSRSWVLFLVSILTTVALIGMFWPLLLVRW